MCLIVTLDEVVPQEGHHSNGHWEVECDMHRFSSLLLIEAETSSLISPFARSMLIFHGLHEVPTTPKRVYLSEVSGSISFFIDRALFRVYSFALGKGM